MTAVADVTVFDVRPDAQGVGGVWQRIPLPEGVDLRDDPPNPSRYVLIDGDGTHNSQPAPLPPALTGGASTYIAQLEVRGPADARVLRVLLDISATGGGADTGDPDLSMPAGLAIALRAGALFAVVPLLGDESEPYHFPLAGEVATAVSALTGPLADHDAVSAVLLDRTATSPIVYRDPDEAPIANRLPDVHLDRASRLQARPRLVSVEFGDGYRQVASDGLHSIDRTFDARWDVTPLDALHRLGRFFEARAGAEPFAFAAPGDRDRAWRCTDWRGPRRLSPTHGSLQARFVEHHLW